MSYFRSMNISAIIKLVKDSSRARIIMQRNVVTIAVTKKGKGKGKILGLWEICGSGLVCG